MAMTYMRKIRHAQTICWWLSIDNSSPFILRQERRDKRFARDHGVAHGAWAPNRRVAIERRILSVYPFERYLRDALHIAQSAYARAYLQTHLGLCASIVSDYIPRDELGFSDEARDGSRRRSVAFNPGKSPWLPDVLGPRLPDVEWDPIVGLDRRGVVRLLSSSAMYFDAGYHPGRDRMPREAAMLRAVTIVARRGAAAYWEDVPIEARFKVSQGSAFVDEAVARVREALDDRERAVGLQETYRDWIANDRQRFGLEVRRAFIAGSWEDDTPILPARG
ncbi:hypothetical protein HII28_14340 [Planctomonas sp. JC2975]|uniref:hypothetical protein n=1 Tax=Planctomonas sp. JC2975 TaxID=2729626 RepID=UPI00147641E3|nr:hypothetical protein [Planctomonas sp. JC2975]NNC13051.1 hypothetical protein [Planctomonas sp. JC2975]